MSKDPSRILFWEPHLSGGMPLFKSQADLARAVQEIKTGKVDEAKTASMRGFINQVLRPGKDAHSRALSPKLKEAIFSAIRSRIEGDEKAAEKAAEKVNEIHVQLEIAFAELRQAGISPFENRMEYDELEKAAALARVHFILTPEPAEISKTTSSDALRLTREMTERLGLISLGRKEEDVKYIFYVPDFGVAAKLWTNLHDFLIDNQIQSEEASKRLKAIDEESRLIVHTTKESVCVPPTVVYDPENRDARKGFVLFYHEDDKISVAIYDKISLELWIRTVYYELVSTPRDFNVSRIHWKDIIDRKVP